MSLSERRGEQFLQRLRRAVPVIVQRSSALEQWAGRIDGRLDELEARRAVSIVSVLPAEAPAATLLRTTTSGDLYLGNGPGRPLSRFPPIP